MHGKMVVLGSGELYVGSVNYTVNSTQRNRELGIIFANSAIAQHLAQDLFLKDWYVADSVTADDLANPPNCPTNTLNPLSEKNNT
jgi:phosphatidylserine/phosphatidylglycerophosphate/cardiolipin synthase-like enzyme